jgi:integrase
VSDSTPPATVNQTLDVVFRAVPTQSLRASPKCEVFPSPAGRLRDPKNTNRDLRRAYDTAGRPEISSHAFRRSVATAMDAAGLTPRMAADQLGHEKISMTTDVYFGRRTRDTGAARILQALAD